MKLIWMTVVLMFAGSAANSQETAAPTVETNVRTALGVINHGCVQIVLVRKAVVVGIPCRLPSGGFDDSFWNAITFDQQRARLEKGFKSHWIKSPAIVAKIFGDGNKPFRERVKAGGLEADRYDWADRHIPDYMFAVMKADAEIEKQGGPTAPPYYLKMDVDMHYGPRAFWSQELVHFLLHKSTDQDEIAETLRQREAIAQAQRAVLIKAPPSSQK